MISSFGQVISNLSELRFHRIIIFSICKEIEKIATENVEKYNNGLISWENYHDSKVTLLGEDGQEHSYDYVFYWDVENNAWSKEEYFSKEYLVWPIMNDLYEEYWLPGQRGIWPSGYIVSLCFFAIAIVVYKKIILDTNNILKMENVDNEWT